MTDASTEQVYAITRPDPKLFKLYLVRCVLTGPLLPILLIPHWFRYHTLRYRFDNEGIGFTVGVIFRRESYITYSRMQDIHLSRGLLERWFGLGSVEVQTAAGSSEAEIRIEGLTRFNEVRDFLYTRMRGGRGIPEAGPKAGGDAVAVLGEIRDELRAVREALEKRGRV